jgi:hypothetical protein
VFAGDRCGREWSFASAAEYEVPVEVGATADDGSVPPWSAVRKQSTQWWNQPGSRWWWGMRHQSPESTARRKRKRKKKRSAPSKKKPHHQQMWMRALAGVAAPLRPCWNVAGEREEEDHGLRPRRAVGDSELAGGRAASVIHASAESRTDSAAW